MALLAIGGLGLLFYGLIGQVVKSRPQRDGLVTRWVKQVSARTESRAKARARWAHFTKVDPQTGDYLIGIRRSWRWWTPAGPVDQADMVTMHRISAGDIAAKLNAEGEAILRAQQCNDALLQD